MPSQNQSMPGGPLESDTCRDYVLPRLKDAGWSLKKLLAEKHKGIVDRMSAVLLLEDYVTAHGLGGGLS